VLCSAAEPPDTYSSQANRSTPQMSACVNELAWTAQRHTSMILCGRSRVQPAAGVGC
jgi:adenylosuccinate lyase